jgi:hypothetical protein
MKGDYRSSCFSSRKTGAGIEKVAWYFESEANKIPTTCTVYVMKDYPGSRPILDVYLTTYFGPHFLRLLTLLELFNILVHSDFGTLS